MSTKRLKRVGINREVLQKLNRCNILTCRDLLSKTDLELLRHISLSYQTVKDIIQTVSLACAPKPITAYEIWKGRREISGFFPTSLPDLDKVLHNGIPTGTITEIAGPSGCGKTQFSMMLSVLATLPTHLGGLDGAVVYIDTESAFSAERLVEIAQTRHPDIFNSEAELMNLTRKVFVSQVQTCASLLNRLNSLETDIIRQQIKLVILDSVASLVRKEYDNQLGKNFADRTNFLSREATILKYLAEAFSIPIVVTNQITTRFGSRRQGGDTETEGVSMEGDGGYVTAALGNTWSHSVNTRLILQYLHGNKRQVLVAKSPIAPFTAFTYTIQARGIVQDDHGAGHYDGTDPGIQHIRVRSAIPMDSLTF